MGEDNKLARKALRSSYISTIISISLVLFMIGTLGLLLLNAKKLSDYVKENVTLSIILKAESAENDINSLVKLLQGNSYVKDVKYINKEEAAKNLKQELGEDFIAFLDYNPLLPSIDVHLKSEFAEHENIQRLKESLSNVEIIKESYFQESLVNLINKNVRTISLIILGFSALLFFIAGALINNTIRLSLYAKRLLIKSMKLVGATRNFIRKPFLIKGILQGFYGAIIANILLVVLFYYAKKQIPELMVFEDITILATVLGMVIILGIFVSGISTYFAVNKYLRQRTEDIY